MKYMRVMMLCLVAAFVGSAMLASTASAKGPFWQEEKEAGKQSILEKDTEKEEITFKGGKAKLETIGKSSVVCKEVEQTGKENNLKGGDPGTDEAELDFKGCESLGMACQSGATAGVIQANVNSELQYESAEKAKKHEGPFLLAFRAKGEKLKEIEWENQEKKLVKGPGQIFTKFKCGLTEIQVAATGNERPLIEQPPGLGGAPGQLGVLCKLPKGEEDIKTHEIECPEKQIEKAFSWKFKKGEKIIEQTEELEEDKAELVAKIDGGKWEHAVQIGSATVEQALGKNFGVKG